MQISEQLRVEIQRSVAASLAEDVGTGDLTAQLIPGDVDARGRVITRESAILCGTAWFEAAFAAMEPSCTVLWHAEDGDRIEPGQVLCDVIAGARALLTAERTALNFLQLLSGTATVTRSYVDAVAGTEASIVDTRKTLPGLRLAQKYAVLTGGGVNHRIGLYDGILVRKTTSSPPAALPRSSRMHVALHRPTSSSRSRSSPWPSSTRRSKPARA